MNLKSMTLPELSALLKEMGQPAFRAKQLYGWLHRGVRSYEEMTNLPGALRAALAEKYPGMSIMLTMGKSGCLYKGNGETVRLGACHVDAVDTTAAGDAFTAALTLEFLRTGDMERAVRYANAVGAITVSRAGASPSIPTADEVEKFLETC